MSVSNLWPVYSLYNSIFIAPETVLQNLAIFEKWLYEEFYPAAVDKKNMYPVVKMKVSLNVRQIYESHWPIAERPRKYYTEPVIDDTMKIAMKKGVKLEDHWIQVGPYWLKRMTTEHPGFCWTEEDFHGPDFINDEIYHDLKHQPSLLDRQLLMPTSVRRTLEQRGKRIKRKKQQLELESE